MTDKRIAGSVRIKEPNRPSIYTPPEIGQKIGRMTVVGYDKARKRWMCRCECGEMSLRQTTRLQGVNPMCRKCRLKFQKSHPWGT